ncbi:hypothetical protein HDU88_005726 [Geranomyces variabilis]|nr:hypothetical protein HDU88_005726 [Geranomyces variabilis]
MAIPDNRSGSELVVKFGLTKDLYRRLGDHERHFGALPGTELRVAKFMLTDEDELRKAEAVMTCSRYNEVMLLPAKSLPKALAFYAQQQEHFAQDGRLLRELNAALKSQAEGHPREVKNFEDYKRLTDKILNKE